MKCLSDEELNTYLGHNETPDVDARVTHHVDSCVKCLQRLERLSGRDSAISLRCGSPIAAASVPEEIREKIYQIAGAGESVVPGTMAGKLADVFNLRDINASLSTISSFDETTFDPQATIASQTKSPASQPSPLMFGQYELLEEIARGGMGIVFRARDQRLNRVVALKQILEGRLADEKAILRFQSEARIAGGLHHPGIVPVLDVGQDDGRHYLTMPFVDGRTLAMLLREGPLDPRTAAEMLRALADAIQHAHEQGVLHRDLKPGNILITPDGCPQITDFGLARSMSTDSRMTSTGQLLGTPSYMAPEQVRGRDDQLGPATDTYALGVILYEMLCGRPPFQAANHWQTLARVVREEPVPLIRQNPLVPRNLVAICEKCLSKPVDHRYVTARQLADDLSRFLDGRTVQARPISSVERCWRFCLRNKAQSIAVLTSILLATSLSVLLIWSRVSQREAQQASIEFDLLQRAVNTEKLFVTLARVRETLGTTDPEGRGHSLEQLNSVGAMARTAEQSLELRSLTAQALARPGLTTIATVAEGFPAARIQFSPDGRCLAIGELYCAGAPRILLVDVNTQEISHTLVAACEDDLRQVPPPSDDDPANGVRTIVFEPNGTRLLVGLRDGSVHLWDNYSEGGSDHDWFMAQEAWVNGAAFTHRPKVLVSWSSGADDAIRKWERQSDGQWLKTGELISARGSGEPGTAVGYTQQTLYVAEKRKLLSTSVDAFNHPEELSIAEQSESDTAASQSEFGGSGLSLVVSPDGRFIAGQRVAEISVMCSQSGHRLIDLTDPSLVDAAHQSEVFSLRFHPTEPWLISTGADQRVKLWDFSSGDLLLSFVVPGDGLVTATFSPDGHHVAVTGMEQTLLMRLEGLNAACSLGLQTEVIHTVAHDSQRGRIAMISEAIIPDRLGHGNIAVCDTRTRTTVFCQPLDHLLDTAPVFPPGICLSANQKWLAYHGRSRRTLLLNLQSGHSHILHAASFPRTMTMDDHHVWLAFEEDDTDKVVGPGAQIASFDVANLQKKVHIANSRAEEESRVSYISQLLLTRHGLLVASQDGSVLLIDREDGHEILSWRGRTVAARSLAVTDDHALVAVGYQDGTIDVHTLPDGKLFTSWMAHRDVIDALSFSADGHRLLSGSTTGTLRLWQQSPADDNYSLLMNIVENRRPITWAMLDASGQTVYVHFLKERAIRCYQLDQNAPGVPTSVASAGTAE